MEILGLYSRLGREMLRVRQRVGVVEPFLLGNSMIEMWRMWRLLLQLCDRKVFVKMDDTVWWVEIKNCDFSIKSMYKALD